MLSRKAGYGCDFGFRDLISIDTCGPDPLVMDLQHDPDRVGLRALKDRSQDENDKVHRGVVVVMQKHFIQRGLLHPRLALGDDSFIAIWIDDWHGRVMDNYPEGVPIWQLVAQQVSRAPVKSFLVRMPATTTRIGAITYDA